MWGWRRLEKIIWIYLVKSEVLHGVKKEGNILHIVKRGKDNWIGYILSGNCLLQQVIEGEIVVRMDVMGR